MLYSTNHQRILSLRSVLCELKLGNKHTTKIMQIQTFIFESLFTQQLTTTYNHADHLVRDFVGLPVEFVASNCSITQA